MSNTEDNKRVTGRIESMATTFLLQLPVLGQGKPVYSVKDIRTLQKNLRAIEPELRRRFVRDIKSIGREAQKPIVKAIRQVQPPSGMRFNYGKTGWGREVAADKTKVRFRTQAGGQSLTTSLVSVRLESPAANILDMAGRSGRSVGKGYMGTGYTREFTRRDRYGNIIVTKRRTTQAAGNQFIQRLNEASGVTQGRASRMAWPAVENNLPNIERRIDEVIQNYYKEANRKFS
jgi:hypothetical protein